MNSGFRLSVVSLRKLTKSTKRFFYASQAYLIMTRMLMIVVIVIVIAVVIVIVIMVSFLNSGSCLDAVAEGLFSDFHTAV